MNKQFLLESFNTWEPRIRNIQITLIGILLIMLPVGLISGWVNEYVSYFLLQMVICLAVIANGVFLIVMPKIRREEARKELFRSHKERFMEKVRTRVAEESGADPWPRAPWQRGKTRRNSVNVRLGDKVDVHLDTTNSANVDDQITEAMTRLSKHFGALKEKKKKSLDDQIDDMVERLSKIGDNLTRGHKPAKSVTIRDITQTGEGQSISIESGGKVTINGVEIDADSIATGGNIDGEMLQRIANGEIEPACSNKIERDAATKLAEEGLDGEPEDLPEEKDKKQSLLDNPLL